MAGFSKIFVVDEPGGFQGPDDPVSLLDACLAFGPARFQSCPSFAEVEAALRDAGGLDFDQGKSRIPSAWTRLRQEARPIHEQFNIWEASLAPIMRPGR